MSDGRLTITELRELISNGEAKDPLVFLECIMNGQDPRKTSGIYDLIMEIESFSNGEIAISDWNEVVSYAMTHSKYKEVSISESTSAAKTLAEYLHAKRKNIELNNTNSTGGDVAAHPLSQEEIELFKEKFNEEF